MKGPREASASRICGLILLAGLISNSACRGADVDGPDMPLVDASTDAGDALADASAVRDVAAPPPTGDPDMEWAEVGWNPNDCELLHTKSKSVGLGKLNWLECNSPIKGCRYLDVSGIEGAPSYPKEKFFGFSPITLEDGTLRLALVAIFDSYRIHGVFDEEGEQLIAWKADKTCGAHPVQAHPDGRISLAVTQYDDKGDFAASRFVFGDIETLLGRSPSIVDVTADDMWGRRVEGNLTRVYRGVLGPRMVAFYAAAPPRVLAWNYKERPTRIDIPDSILEQSNPILVGDEIVFETYGHPETRGFSVRRVDGTVEMLYQKPSVWPAELYGDRENVVWQESINLGDGTYSVELWTAPLSTKGPWSARKVATLGPREMYQGRYGEGYFAFRVDGDTLGLIRTSDGARFDIAPPPEFGWVWASGVVAGEVWALVHLHPGGYSLRHTVVRIPIDSIVTGALQ